MEKVTKKFEEEIKVLKDEIKLKDKEIDRLRMCILKYRKIPMTKYKALRKLGISEYNVHMVANTRRRYYWVASTVVLHIAISNK